jgi:hypothetical protein
MRTITLLICLGISLAGCAGAGAAHMVPSAAGDPSALAAKARAESASAAPAHVAPAHVAANTRSAKQKAEDSKEADDESWWKEGGITREKINAMCWMKYEHGRKDLPLDTRADLVNQCVIDTLKKHPL